MKTKIETDIVIKDELNRVVETRGEFELNLDSTVAGSGRPMNLEFLKTNIIESNHNKINHYKDVMKRESATDDDKKSAGEAQIAITLGRESLMLLLSQEGCEGIRFYFCNNPWGRASIAAVAVRAAEVRGQIVAQDIGIEGDQHVSFLSANKLSQKILNFEVGPPYDVKQYFGELDEEKATADDPFIEEMRKLF